MIIGHLPAGFLCTKLLEKPLYSSALSKKLFLWAGILGGIAPDFDMFYFYFFDNRQHHHHTYWPHFPIVWITLLLISLIALWITKKGRVATIATIFSINGVVHLLLDSIVGDVWWLMPFVDQPFALFTVPARFDWWVLSFIFHWSFALELIIAGSAIALVVKAFKRKTILVQE